MPGKVVGELRANAASLRLPDRGADRVFCGLARGGALEDVRCAGRFASDFIVFATG